MKIALVKCKNRWHPTIFTCSPKPSEYEDDYCRHVSRQHHTLGFTDIEEARLHAEAVAITNRCYFCKEIFEVDDLDNSSFTVYLQNDNWKVGSIDVA